MINKEEMDEIISGLSIETQKKKIFDVYSYYVQRVRNKLHVILGMSPVGDQLRNRMRKFPALINCCTINWLNPWPEEALYSVANMFLENFPIDKFFKRNFVY